LDVDVGAKSRVVGQVPAIVIGIFVDHDVVAAPIPAIDECEIERRDAPIIVAEPKTVGTASAQAPHVAATEAACEAAMLKGVIEVVAGVRAPSVMPYPFIVVVNVRSFGVAFLIAMGHPRRVFVLRWPARLSTGGSRTMTGNVSATYGMAATSAVTVVLRESR
jgi:hypothetical protein